MRIAVTISDGNVFQHYGHSEAFMLYDVLDNKIINAELISTNGNGHGYLSELLHISNVQILICGGIGAGAINALTEYGIKIYAGVTGNADAAVSALLNNTLSFNPNFKCNHHGDDHDCSSHDCGSHRLNRNTLK